MTNPNASEKNAGNDPGMYPIRCSVCGKKFLNVYANTLPGIIFASCSNGHKTSYRTGEPSRKAV